MGNTIAPLFCVTVSWGLQAQSKRWSRPERAFCAPEQEMKSQGQWGDRWDGIRAKPSLLHPCPCSIGASSSSSKTLHKGDDGWDTLSRNVLLNVLLMTVHQMANSIQWGVAKLYGNACIFLRIFSWISAVNAAQQSPHSHVLWECPPRASQSQIPGMGSAIGTAVLLLGMPNHPSQSSSVPRRVCTEVLNGTISNTFSN